MNDTVNTGGKALDKKSDLIESLRQEMLAVSKKFDPQVKIENFSSKNQVTLTLRDNIFEVELSIAVEPWVDDDVTLSIRSKESKRWIQVYVGSLHNTASDDVVQLATDVFSHKVKIVTRKVLFWKVGLRYIIG